MVYYNPLHNPTNQGFFRGPIWEFQELGESAAHIARPRDDDGGKRLVHRTFFHPTFRAERRRPDAELLTSF